MPEPIIIRVEAAVADAIRGITNLRDTWDGAKAILQSLGAAAEKTYSSLQGDKLAAQANAMAQAIEQMGGVSRLTDAEIKRVNTTLTEAIAKYEALGVAVPRAVAQLWGETQRAVDANTQFKASVTAAVREQERFIAILSQWNGQAVTQKAVDLAKAITSIGGASKLTTDEVKRASSVFTEYEKKMDALGQEVPADIRQIINELKKFETQADTSFNAAARDAEAFKRALESINGANVTREARAMAAAIEQFGGVTRLTVQEQQRVMTVLQEAINKYRAMGQAVPAEIQRIYKELGNLQAKNKVWQEQTDAVKRYNEELRNLTNRFNGREGAIRQAQLYTDAVSKAGGVTKLTKKEQEELNRVLKEAIEKYRALGTQAPAEMMRLERATATVSGTNQKLLGILQSMPLRIFGAATAAQLAATVIRNAFSSAVDAVQALINKMGEMLVRGGEAERLFTNFQQLAVAQSQQAMRRGLQGFLPTELLESGRKGLRGLASDFDIVAAANKAMLLGLKITPNEFRILTDAAIKLGRGMNMDANKALNDLIIALGRSSPRILDNLGLIVKIRDANQEYAASIGRNVMALSAEERQYAFYKKSMEVMNRELSKLGDIQLNNADRMRVASVQLRNWIDMMSIAIAVSPALGKLMEGVGSAISKAFGGPATIDSVNNYIKIVDSVAMVMLEVMNLAAMLGIALLDMFAKPIPTGLAFLGLMTDVLSTQVKMGAIAAATVPGLSGLAPILADASKTLDNVAKSSLILGGQAQVGYEKARAALVGFRDSVPQLREEMKKASAEGVKQIDIMRALQNVLGVVHDETANSIPTYLKNIDVKKTLAIATEKLRQALELAEKNHQPYTETIKNHGKALTDVVNQTDEYYGSLDRLPDVIKRAWDAAKQISIDQMLLRGNEDMAKRAAAIAEQGFKDAANWVKVLNDQTKRGLEVEKTLWRDYFAVQDRLTGDSLEKRLNAIKIEKQNKIQQLTDQGNLTERTMALVTAWEQAAAEEATKAWQEHVEDVKASMLTFGNVIKGTLKSVPDLFIKAFTGGGGVGGAVKAVTTKFFSGFGEQMLSANGLLGGVMQKATTGIMNLFGSGAATAFAEMIPFIGQALGPIISMFGEKLIQAFNKPDWKRAQQELAKGWGVNISEELAKSIEETMKTKFKGMKNNRWMAEVFQLGDIIKEAGGITQANIDKLLPQLRNAFVFMDEKKFKAEDVAKVLNESFPAFAEYFTKSGKLASKQFLEIIDLAKRFKVESQAITDFLNTNFSNAISGLAKMSAGVAAWTKESKTSLEANSTETERLGRLIVATFNAGIKNGKSFTEAIAEVGPALDNLIASFKAMGTESSNAALNELVRYRDLVNANQTLIASVESLNGVMVAMHNIGALNAETLADMEAQGLSMYDQMIAAGFTEVQTLQSMSGWLNSVYQAHQQLGIPIDDNTQKLLGQAEAAGILETSSNSMVGVMKDGFSALITALGGDLPEAWTKAAKAATDATATMQGSVVNVAGAVSGISQNLKNIPWDDFSSDAVDAATAAADAINAVTYGASPGGIVDVIRHLIKASDQFYQTGDDAMKALGPVYDATHNMGNMDLPLGPGGDSAQYKLAALADSLGMQEKAEAPVSVSVSLSAVTLDEKKSFVERELVPAILDALDKNSYGALTRMRQALER